MPIHSKKGKQMANIIKTIRAASSKDAIKHFRNKLSFETDCWDTHEAMTTDSQNFVLLDVRSPNMYQQSHIPGAINLPQGKIIRSRLNQWPSDTLFVVYCAGPHCNGANKAALKIAELGRPVKEMIGGMTGWADEGFTFCSGAEPGTIKQSKKA